MSASCSYSRPIRQSCAAYVDPEAVSILHRRNLNPQLYFYGLARHPHLSAAKTELFVFVWKENIFETKLFENGDVTIIT